MYSSNWITVNIKPKNIVIPKDVIELYLSLDTNAWWHQVMLAPEPNKIEVFNNGTPKGLIIVIPFGGHEHPISTEGDKEEWKKAQKKLKKNKISDTINSIIPIFNPIATLLEW